MNIVSINERQESPIMRQYHELKQNHPDAVLLFRCGDFYESFDEDAKTCADILGITLMYRDNNVFPRNPEDRVAGFPHYALDTYLPKLIRAGKRVAICDQLEDPKMNKKP